MCLVGRGSKSNRMRVLKTRHVDKINIQERARTTARPASFNFKK